MQIKSKNGVLVDGAFEASGGAGQPFYVSVHDRCKLCGKGIMWANTLDDGVCGFRGNARLELLDDLISGKRMTCSSCGEKSYWGLGLSDGIIYPAKGGGMVENGKFEEIYPICEPSYSWMEVGNYDGFEILGDPMVDLKGSESSDDNAYVTVERMSCAVYVRYWLQRLEGDADNRDENNYELYDLRG